MHNVILYLYQLRFVYPQDGLTGLMLATQKDQPAIVEALLDAKADPDITDKVCTSLPLKVYGLLM